MRIDTKVTPFVKNGQTPDWLTMSYAVEQLMTQAVNTSNFMGITALQHLNWKHFHLKRLPEIDLALGESHHLE